MIKTAGVSQARFAVRVIHEGCPNFCVVAISREVHKDEPFHPMV